MSRFREFALPDLGEGLTEGEILQWLVAPGDTVTLNQPVVEVETAKAAVELPSPFAGIVTALLFEAGTIVDVGSPIIRFDTDPLAVPEPAAGLVAPEADLVPQAPQREAVLVGYGVKTGTSVRRRPRHAGQSGGPAVPAAAAAVPVPAAIPPPGLEQLPVHTLAKPPVRKLARDHGVDLRALSGSGAGGVITREDVEAAVSPSAGPAAETPLAGAGSSGVLAVVPDRRIPIKGVRKATAAAMVGSAFTAPHVTLFLTEDVTATMELVASWKSLPEFAGTRVSPLLVVIKALLAAIRRNPEINARWDETAQEIVVLGQVNLGIAAATPRGLLVPNIKGAGQLDTVGLAEALGGLTERARAGRTTPEEMARGTITITNVGSFGVDNGTPILNPGEAAILCFGAVREQPWVHEGAIAIRQVTQLSLSFDHRLVDGQLGAQVLADIGAALRDPSRLLAWS